jgi:hypothetical protein
MESRKIFQSCSDKNEQQPFGKEPLEGSKSRLSVAKHLSLVAGDVTGGGGKATTTKT